MRSCPHLVLGLTVLTVSFAVAQTDSSPMTLQQAIDAKRRDGEQLRAEVDRLARAVAKAQDANGPFHTTTVDLRKQMAAANWRSLDSARDLLGLSALLRRTKGGQ